MDVLKIEKKVFVDAISKVMGAVDKKLINPILQHCLVQKSEGVLLVSSNDLEMQIQVRKHLNLRDSGQASPKLQFTIPAKTAFDFCRALQGDFALEIQKQDSRIKLKSPTSSLDVTSFDPLQFPAFTEKPGASGKTVFSVSRKKLKDLLESIQYAMAISDVRYYLNGIFMQISGSDLTCVATDGHRLALAKTPVDLSSFSEETARGVILPRRAVVELIRLLDNEDYPLVFSFSRETATIGFDDLEFSFKLIEGKYPDYRRVLPKHLPYKLTLDRDQLKEALALVSPVLSSKDRGVTFNFTSAGIEIRAINSEHHEVMVSLDARNTNVSTKIAFNLNYIADFISHTKAKLLTLEYQDASIGAIFSHEGHSCYVVMPLIL